MTSYKGLDEASILHALFHAAKVEDAYRKIDRPGFTLADAQDIFPSWPLRPEEADEDLTLARQYGRFIGVTFWPGKKLIDPTGYDDMNGKHACRAVIDALRGKKP